MSKWENATLRRIDENCVLLYAGYSEKVEYALDVAYHRAHCHHHGKSTLPKNDCECPVVNEKRVRNQKRPGLLQQLQEFTKHKDTDRNPKAERGAPRVKVVGRPPGDMAGFFALDELVCDILSVVERALVEVGRDHTWAAIKVEAVLAGLAGQVAHFIDSRPDVVRDIDIAAGRWVDSARSTLKISTSSAIFDSVTCGNCGGGLASPWGTDSTTVVRCVGSPAEPPCGTEYPPDEWLALYESARGQG